MDEDGIGLVLARAAELRLKINNCIHKETLSNVKQEKEEAIVVNGDNKGSGSKFDDDEEEEDYDDEAERLLNIHQSLESLEAQLSILQKCNLSLSATRCCNLSLSALSVAIYLSASTPAIVFPLGFCNLSLSATWCANLQLQQRYDREVALAEIEFSRKLLLEKLKEYKGEDFEVIHEASAFADETVEHDNDLLLPPYPSRLPQSLTVDNGYISQFRYPCKSVQNGVVTGELTNEGKNNIYESSSTSRKGFGHFICSVAKMVLPLVCAVYVLSMSGVAQNLGKKTATLKFFGIFRQPTIEEKGSVLGVQCPPGKVLVVEDGEARCLVKERVEIPFDSVPAKPDINYGNG